MSIGFRWQIHRRIRYEEVVRLEHKACVFHRHDRKVLGLANVAVTKAVPHHDVTDHLAARAYAQAFHAPVFFGQNLNRLVIRQSDLCRASASSSALASLQELDRHLTKNLRQSNQTSKLENLSENLPV